MIFLSINESFTYPPNKNVIISFVWEIRFWSSYLPTFWLDVIKYRVFFLGRPLICNVILLASFHTQSTLLIYWIKCKECRECWWIRIESSEPTSWQLGPKFLELIDRLNPLLCSTGHQNNKLLRTGITIQ